MSAIKQNRRIIPVHPGAYIREITLEMNLSQSRLAQALGVSPMRISHVMRGTRPLTAELALRLGRLFGQSPSYWMGLQSRFDLHAADDELLDRVKREVRPLAA